MLPLTVYLQVRVACGFDKCNFLFVLSSRIVTDMARSDDRYVTNLFIFFSLSLLAQSFNFPLFGERIKAYNHLVGGCCKRKKRFACLQRERNPFFLASPGEKKLVRRNAAPLSRNGVNDDAQAVTPPPVSAVALERFNERVLAGGRNKALATVTALLGTMPFGRCTACTAGNDARQVDFLLKFFALFL